MTARPRGRAVTVVQSWGESGRGLAMVELIADAWGIDRAEGAPGRKVWFELKA
ncbi:MULTISPECIES: hypothetical protein [Streptomyces violaceusniger group]|uniref:ATP-binding protein n=2 Tax=Streptomyces javensis TaxID=114698 RepID=A0ABS0RE66_9ACTN|nr:hypothetical protein [Streptomyces javensis]MBI0315687.1 hypothetical protein [Streptomyces javensis]